MFAHRVNTTLRRGVPSLIDVRQYGDAEVMSAICGADLQIDIVPDDEGLDEHHPADADGHDKAAKKRRKQLAAKAKAKKRARERLLREVPPPPAPRLRFDASVTRSGSIRPRLTRPRIIDIDSRRVPSSRSSTRR